MAATVSPTSVTWAKVAVGVKGAPKVVTLTNGTSAITISSIAIGGTNAADFSIYAKTCGTSLAASASCTVSVLFAPTAAGTRTATLTFKDTGSGSPQSVALSGLGTATSSGNVTATPSSLTFGTVAIGASSASQAATLSNGTSASISLASVTISGTNAGDFAISSKSCGSSLAASASCSATVTFKPTATGARSATLKFTDSGSGSPQSVALTGTGGSSGSGSVTASPSVLSFGSIAVGSTGGSQTATLSNGTKASISVSGVAISGTNAGDFAISSKSCGSTLAASASCTATVSFKPTASGSRSATLKFTDSGSGSPQSVALAGTGGTSTGAFTISPTNPTVVEGQALQFSATTSVSWAASCGSIGATSGLYTAPGSTGTCTITATEIGDNTKTASTTAHITSSPSSGSLAVYPTSAAVYVGSQQIFQAQLSGVPDGHSLSYSVDGISDGNGSVGTITNQGVYTAPSGAGTHHISVHDNSLGTTATATATVFASVTADFGSRGTGMHAVASNLFGAERMDSMHNTADLDLIKAGGINYARFYALIPSVFKTATPNWAPIDSNVSKISAGGVHVILQIYQSPPWLQPSSNPCPAGNEPNAFPTDINKWGQMAAQYVKHMDEKFPGVVTDYEIWNEPNTAALCVPTASKMSDYLKLYNAAAPLMRAQAKADGSNARVGGPATAGMQSSWVKAMLSDPTASQNIDFMSYHDYMFSSAQLGAQWNTYNGTVSVYQKTQNTGSGPMQTYQYASSLVSAGKQPQGKNLPIYNTEYNLNWDYAKDCCENDPTYSPVWNGLYVADVLNAVYAGVPNVIGHMVYFAANAHPYFCLIGQINANMDCTYPIGSSPQPYPQYFLYQLVGSPSYLGLQNGGTMAKSISPSTQGNGLVVTAFFTSGQNSILLINPTGDTLNNVPVTAANTGLTSPEATLYQIVNGESIRSSSLSLTAQGGTSYSTTVTMGPYSVMAIALHH